MRWIVLVAALAACDQFLKLDTVPAPPDAPVYLVCAQQVPPPFFCADFDEPALQYYTEGQPALITTTADVSATASDESPPNALLVDSQDGNSYMIEEQPVSPVVTQIHASFAMQVVRMPPDYRFEVLRISFNGANQCQAWTQVAPNLGIQLRTDCSTRTEIPVFPAVPTGWQHIELDLDATALTATMSVGSDIQMMTLAPAGPVAGPPALQLGVLYSRTPGPGPAVALDDVVVTIQ